MKEIIPPVTAMASIVAVYVAYLCLHPDPSDGILMACVVASISGLGGFVTNHFFDKIKDDC